MRHGFQLLVIGLATLIAGPFAAAEPPNQRAPEDELRVCQQSIQLLQGQLLAAQGAEQQDDKLKKQVDLLQKQIEAQQKMIELLLERVKKQPLPVPRLRSCKLKSPPWNHVPSRLLSAIRNCPKPSIT
jgi:hypothetical protein